MGPQKANVYPRYIGIFGLFLILCLIAYYIYMLHIGEAQRLLMSIRHLGLTGIVAGILFQTLVNILPVPGEFTSIALMEIYGPVEGGVYSWIGGVLGAVGALYVTKWIGKPIFGKMAEPFLHKVDEYISMRPTLGLLIIRFVPFVPYHLVNYAAGLLNVKIWGFVWTTGLGILPHSIAMSGIYAGVRNGSIVWGIIGGAILAVLIAISWYAKARKKKSLMKF